MEADEKLCIYSVANPQSMYYMYIYLSLLINLEIIVFLNYCVYATFDDSEASDHDGLWIRLGGLAWG